MAFLSSIANAPNDTSRTALILRKFRLPLALLFGACITAGTTYALVRRVQDLMAGAAVNNDPAYWAGVARDKAYDRCYNGCNDCSDTNWAFNACAKTAKAVVPGVICDGNLMWNWKVEDRYPAQCLDVVGKMYKDEAIKKKKKGYRKQLAIIILTILGGIVGTLVAYKLLGVVANKLDRRRRLNPRPQNRQVQEVREPYPGSDSETGGGSPSRRRPKKTKMSAIRLKPLATAAALASSVRKATAWPCTGYGDPVDVYFQSPNATITAVVHGWFSNCYDYVCGWSCTGGTDSNCTPVYCTGVDYIPADYVDAVTPKVVQCGFKTLNASEVGDNKPSVRVANAWIERKLWVTVRVDRLNVTDDATAEEVFCLHALGGQ
ncbi:hypothetical protein BU26DRAFT_514137 [Trematosphaeria pertusa]|uniref:Uncharacterized protein n=1 Tax=Trematosphaeria pertusa TaxID=390896 RepID=A0A6A6J6E0_9PLEO|nr:uncharacterized protein BU26DRAFT_514137 [Trematosphaeria pertusa]KAF2257460.1 hypothetical protein BU26DRAFT_514137 [Trematosphaeria pertusa]